MKIMISLVCILLLAGCKPKEEKRLDTDFEGAITYKLFDWEAHGPDSIEAERFQYEFLKDTMISYFDEGSFFARTDGTIYDYQYFNPHTNRVYYKMKGKDSLWTGNTGKSLPGQEPLLDVKHEFNTDTILGYACNKLTLKYKKETRIYLYSPEIATNPEWYQHVKAMNHDVAYKQMKAYYLSMRSEFADHAFTVRAIRITPGRVQKDIFPKVEEVPQIPFN